MNDKELLETAILYGTNALVWRRKFVGLLPEINRRKLYERKGCVSIFEFAAKFAGLSHDQVKIALNLEERFSELPALHGLLTSGEVSINRLVRIAGIATPENHKELSVIVQKLPQKAVETFVRDQKPQVEMELTGLRAQELGLNEELCQKLLELKEKGIDVNELFLKTLEHREEEIAEEKSVPVQPAKSRRIPIKIQRLVKKEFGTKCSIQTCKKPSEQIHHTQTFALSRAHDPNYLAPLCREHHTIAHAINLKVQEKRFAQVSS